MSGAKALPIDSQLTVGKLMQGEAIKLHRGSQRIHRELRERRERRELRDLRKRRDLRDVFTMPIFRDGYPYSLTFQE